LQFPKFAKETTREKISPNFNFACSFQSLQRKEQVKQLFQKIWHSIIKSKKEETFFQTKQSRDFAAESQSKNNLTSM